MRRLLPRVLLLSLAVPALANDRVVLLYGESEYGSETTMPALAASLEAIGIECVLLASEDGRLPAFDALDDAELLVLFLRFRRADDEQMAALARWFAAGKPAVALRTTSHAFLDEPGWFPPLFGGHYKAHAPNSLGTHAVTAVGAADHPVLRGVPRSFDAGFGGTYDTQPLADGAEVLLFGRSGELPAQPLAWTYATRPGQRLVYTSLGSQENFESDAVRTLVANSVLWGLGRDVPAGGAFGGEPHPPRRGAQWEAPAAPAPSAPEGATVLFDGSDASGWRHWDPSTAPHAIHLDDRADTTSGGPIHDVQRWTIDRGALVARPGFGDVITREELGDFHLHPDFLVPPEPPWVPDGFRGASGVYLAGRYEVALLDSWQKDTHAHACGALAGFAAPAVNAARPPGEWQSLDLTYSHRAGEPPRISAWWNDVRVLTDARPEEASAYGFLRPLGGALGDGNALHVANAAGSRECDWGGESFAVLSTFRTTRGGTLAAKCPAEGRWAPDAKALFLRGGRILYDIGWVGALATRDRYDDGEWHTVVLTSDDGVARLFVDGELQAEREDFGAGDEPAFRMKVGAANHDFAGVYTGDIGAVRFYDRSLPADQALALSAGEGDAGDAVWSWAPEWADEPDTPRPAPDGALAGPIRLQADCSEVRFANVWVKPIEDVDHAALIGTWDAAAFARGEEIYSGLCVACHGPDGMRPTNPKARPFALGTLENGADPLRLFHTVTSGYQDMPANGWLTPAQRYDVIHYVRESFLREQNPSQYFEVTDAWLNALPKGRIGRVASSADELPPRDHGPALASQLGDDVGACLTVRLDDDTAIAYDLQVMQSPGAWTGGFLDLAQTQHYQQRGEGRARPGGEALPGLEGWGWGYGGNLAWNRSRRPARGPLPREWLDYHGHRVHGDRLVLSYAVDGREVLEVPGVDRTSGLPVVTHRMRIGPGDGRLELSLVDLPAGGGTPRSELATSAREEGRLALDLVLLGREGASGELERASGAVVIGGGQLAIEENERAVLTIPPSADPAELWILRFSARTAEELAGIRIFLDNLRERSMPPSPAELTGGGPARWPRELVTRGRLGEEDGAYVVDTLTLPASNPWNAWIRTSALDFFEDGRCAVSTYGGDVWIVSGIDADLDELRWRRFAAGMFEPMGLRVVDGQILVTCRDRIVRLHDENGDGEADFYESFFADPDVSPNFHAFNFDLQTDPEGSLYYAKSGQYTDFAMPGAILKVAPDGSAYEVWCTGLRTPNGLGMSPDGRPLVSDNQGNWIPASKVSLTRRGGFYGVFQAVNTNTPGTQTRNDFDQPVLWMPQSFDSSSGGQLWVDDLRFGPLAERYLHTSFGKGQVYPLVVHDVGGTSQGAAWRLPFQFAAGVQRARVNPKDGQVYVVGLSGWQGPAGGADGCLQRIRYTGEDQALLLDARATRSGVELTFSAPLDRGIAADPARYRVKRWNYLWSRDYGSAHYSLERPGERGEDSVAVTGVRVSEDGERVHVELQDMRIANQVQLRVELLAADGGFVKEEVFLTVNRLPDE